MFQVPSVLDIIEERNKQAIRSVLDGLDGTNAVQDALSGGVCVQAFTDALGGTGAVEALHAQLSATSAISAALASPPTFGLDIRRVIDGALIRS